MRDLNQDLEALTRATVLWLGLGNPDGGDDAAGLRLADALRSNHIATVANADLQPERWIARTHIPPGAHIVFLDAADFGASPGAVTWLDATQIQARFPQISTHRIALSTLARLLLARNASGVWLLGIQPASLRPANRLTPVVQSTVELLDRLIRQHFRPKPPANASARPAPPWSGQTMTVAALEPTAATPNPN